MVRLGAVVLACWAVTACITGDSNAFAPPTPPPATVFPDWVSAPHTASGLESTLAASACAPKSVNFALDRTRLIARTSAALTRDANARAAALLGAAPAQPLFSRADLAGLTPHAETDVAADPQNIQLCVLMAVPEEAARALFSRVLEAYETPPDDVEAAFALFIDAND